MVLKKEEESRKGIKKSSFETKNDILFPNNLDNSKNDLSCYFQVLLSSVSGREKNNQRQSISLANYFGWNQMHTPFLVYLSLVEQL
jgi:hypothetical protein